MKVPIRFRSEIFAPFTRLYYDNCTSLDNKTTLDKNNAFKLGFFINLQESTIEIPIFNCYNVEKITYYHNIACKNDKIKAIVVPLQECGDSVDRNTFNGIIRMAFATPKYENHLFKIYNKKGDTYYGGRGIILDSNFTPLILCTKILCKNYENSIGKFTEFRAYINPKIFLEPKKMFNKGVIEKLIPIYATETVPICHYDRIMYTDALHMKVNVIVDNNMGRFFIHPKTPQFSGNIEEELNQCLIDNIQDILNLIK